MSDLTLEEIEAAGVPKLTVKPDGRIGKLEKTVERLERELAETRWCFAELMYKLQMAAAQQLLAQPEMQERLQQALVAQLNGKA